MLSKTYPKEIITAGIICLGLFLSITPFANAGETAKPDCVLCGHLKDAQTGLPVTDAIVRISGGPTSDVRTDANGFYCFEKISESRDYRISIDSNEYVGIYDYQEMPVVNLNKDKQTTKDFEFDRACMVKVQVVDEANQPVEGAELSIRPLDDEILRKMMFQPKRYKRTDKNGITVLGGLTSSKMGYLIIATHSTKTESVREDGTKTSITQPDYAPGLLFAIPASAEYIEPGRIVLQKGFDVTGYAEYEDGVPAPDLIITAYRSYSYGHLARSYPHDSCRSDENGNFTLRHIVPAYYNISANLPVEEGKSKSVAELSTTLPLPDDTPLMINIPKKSTQSLESIQGKMIFVGNSIPDYVNISASSMEDKYDSSARWQKPRNDLYDANFVIEQLLPGKYKLTFSSPYIKEKTIETVEAPSEGLEVELITLERFSLKGTVVNSLTGRPIQSFKARIKQVQSFQDSRNYQPAGQWRDVNNTEGKFDLEAIGQGIYQVQISAEGFAQVCSENINTDENNPVTIELSTGGSIKGRVTDYDGKIIDGAKVLLLSKSDSGLVRPTLGQDPFVSEDNAVETVNGVFEFKNIAAGTESIKVVHPDYAYAVVNDIDVKEGRTTEGIEIVLKKGATVEGYVYDSTGRPQGDVALIFQNTLGYHNPIEEKAGRLITTKTDADGYYRVEGLPEQICYVQRQGGGNNMGVVRRAFVPAEGKTTRFDFGGSPVVTGRVVFDGYPLANSKIDLTTTRRIHSSVFFCNTTTGANGEFTFGGVPNGTWSIYCADPENTSKQLKIATIDCTGEDIDTGMIPSGFSTISVWVEYEQDKADWDVTDVYLQYENIFWARPIVIFEKPTNNNGPFIARNITPGRYRLVVNRGYVTHQQLIDVTEDETNITVLIPEGTASVRGSLIRHNDCQILWRENKDVVCYIEANANNSYEFNNLPAGRYYLSSSCFTNSEALLDFDLTEGEQKVLDIDTGDNQQRLTSVIQVYVIDEHGVPVTEADVRLEDNKGAIEPIIVSTPAYHFEAEPGTYTLTAKMSGYKETRQPVTIKLWDYQAMKRFPDPVLLRLER